MWVILTLEAFGKNRPGKILHFCFNLAEVKSGSCWRKREVQREKGGGVGGMWSIMSLCLLRSTRTSLCKTFTDVRGGGLIRENLRHGIQRSTPEGFEVFAQDMWPQVQPGPCVKRTSFMRIKSCLIRKIKKQTNEHISDTVHFTQRAPKYCLFYKCRWWIPGYEQGFYN